MAKSTASRPGRPRKFDQDDVVHRATLAFWRRGYDETSTEVLAVATGLNQSSLYNAFGSKRGLYLAALDHYNEMLSARLGPLERGAEGIADVERFLAHLSRAKLSREAIPGCMMANALADGSGPDPEITERTNTYERRIQQALTRALDRAVALGEIAAGAPAPVAHIITAAIIGALVASRNGPPRIDDTFVASLGAMLQQWRLTG